MQYRKELSLVHAFFDFAYSVVEDPSGIDALDESYRPLYSDLPVRKVSENPLEYKIWGSINMNISYQPKFLEFLKELPKDRCVIIDCRNNLSYALQADILRLFIINDSNIKFINNDYLKYTRESLIEVRDAIEVVKKENKEFLQEERNYIHQLYFSDPDRINKWLDLPEELLNIPIEEVRQNCK